MENGKWTVENGKRKVESEEWRVESAEWKVESGKCRSLVLREVESRKSRGLGFKRGKVESPEV